ncbi:Fasciclin arabinogalactan protein 6 [Spatholobus suberectus]|nr:Fasciclin arabinogalactan protein 6 [Spatholobus suberectus]
MASTPLTLILLLTLATLLSLQAQAQAQAQAPAPSPSGPVNLTAILEKGGQFTTLIRLLKETQQLTQIQSQLNSTSQGFTLFAPTDNAFMNLKSGALNDLNDTQKVKLVLYHVTPKYYSLSDLLTVSNPVRTQASEGEGTWGLNFAGQGQQVNVSTGVVETPINNALRQKFPLAVYQVDKVLLPLELFGAKSPSSAPSPKSSKTNPDIPSIAKAGGAPSPSGSGKDNSAAAGRNVGFGVIVGLGVICMGALS